MNKNKEELQENLFEINNILPVKIIHMPLMIGAKDGEPVFDKELIPVLVADFEK